MNKNTLETKQNPRVFNQLISKYVLSNIMQFLEPKNIIHIRQTCRRWKDSSGYTWKIHLIELETLIHYYEDSMERNYDKQSKIEVSRMKTRENSIKRELRMFLEYALSLKMTLAHTSLFFCS